jgi:arylsulfatase A-like enzyme/Tfp pilus assembly protein PilF
VLLITIDTVRADHLGCYGYSGIKTPTLDGLARDGIVFERALSQVPLTSPSHAAILTGTYPFQNGMQDFTSSPLNQRFRSVAQAFQANGYGTAAVVSAYVLDRTWGLRRGFDFYDDAFPPEAFETKEIGLVDRKAGESVTRAIRWLSKRQGTGIHRPFFFWLHLYDPHSPYDPPEPFHTEYIGHPYDGEIAYADHELGRLIAWLKANHLYEEILIVALSDHGESLGEHGEGEHGFFIYNSTLRVPLIVKPPAGSGFRPTRISRPVETIAVAPTLLRFAGVKDEIEKQFSSAELLLKQPEKDSPAYGETFYPFNSFGWSPLHSLETGRYQYIDAPKPELYDLWDDPEEKKNLAEQQAATVAVMKEKLRSLLQQRPYEGGTEPASNISPEAAEKLRALGYVAYHSPISPEAIAAGLPDPKDKLNEFNTILAAQDAMQRSDFASAEASLRNLEKLDPQIYVVPFTLGLAFTKQKDWPRAEEEFRKCLQLNPKFDQAMTGLAKALLYQEHYSEAREWLQAALKLNPLNIQAMYEIGNIDSHADTAAAIADYEKALAIQENFAPLHREVGMLYFQQQNYREAAKHLARAADLGLGGARLFNYLGICYDRLGRLQQAVDTYGRALHADDNLAEAHLNLGFTYHRLGRDTRAKREYDKACDLKKDFCKLVGSAVTN